MANKRKSLGRGLGALLGDAAATQSQPPAPTATAADGAITELPVDLLQRGRYQPRIDMRQDSLDELAASIRAQGIVQPIAVRPVGAGGGEQRYEIIAGERRWRAAQLAGLGKVPVVVHKVSDNEAVAMALIENIQREDLNPLEEARALSRLIDEFDMTHEQGAEAVGRSRAAVSNLLRLLDLGDPVQKLVEARRLDMGHARALLGLPAGSQQNALAEKAAVEGWSVRTVEQRVRAIAKGTTRKQPLQPARRDPDIVRLEQQLTERLGAVVNVQHGSGGGGSLKISYSSLDELEGILDRIGSTSD